MYINVSCDINSTLTNHISKFSSYYQRAIRNNSAILEVVMACSHQLHFLQQCLTLMLLHQVEEHCPNILNLLISIQNYIGKKIVSATILCGIFPCSCSQGIQCLWYVDSSATTPSSTIYNDDGTVTQNPTFFQWKQIDFMILSSIQAPYLH